MNEYKRPEKTIKGFVDCKVGDDIGQGMMDVAVFEG